MTHSTDELLWFLGFRCLMILGASKTVNRKLKQGDAYRNEKILKHMSRLSSSFKKLKLLLLQKYTMYCTCLVLQINNTTSVF